MERSADIPVRSNLNSQQARSFSDAERCPRLLICVYLHSSVVRILRLRTVRGMRLASGRGNRCSTFPEFQLTSRSFLE